MNRRDFLKTAGAGTLALACPRGWADEKPVLKVGFMSDTHITRSRKSVERTRLAMETFRTLDVDVMAHVGDLADWHYEEAYASYRETLDAVFPPGGRRPVLLYAFGDHDALEPSRMNGSRSNRIADRRKCWEDMKARLGIDHGYHDVKVIAGYPFLVFPQTLDGDCDLAFYEKTIAEACARFPDRPVFVLEHPPAYDTTYNSLFENPKRRAVLDKFPQVVQFSGHKHASVNNERCFWQGNFTSVQVSCLQKWYGLNVGERVQGKDAWSVVVMEVFPGRLVLRRYDVRGAVEYKPETPWIVGRPPAKERPAAFAAGAAPVAVPDATPFSSVTVRIPTATDPDSVLFYRVEAQRRAGEGWAPVSLIDVFGDFGERREDRTGWRECRFAASVFEAGSEYRFTVTPFGFFGTRGASVSCNWTAPEKAKVEVVWTCEDPMTTQKVVGAGKLKDGWFESPGGEIRIDLPKDAIRGEKGDVFRFTADIRIEQPEAALGAAFGIGRASWSSGLLTPRERTDTLRYTLAETFTGKADGWSFRLAGAGRRRVRFERLLVEKLGRGKNLK